MTALDRMRTLVAEYTGRWQEAGQWVAPSQADAIAFLFTEVAEVLDATLRQKDYVRNNGNKKASLAAEIADVVMMCFVTEAALNEPIDVLPIWADDDDDVLSFLVSSVAVAFIWRNAGEPHMIVEQISNALSAALRYAAHNQIDVPVALRHKLKQMDGKRVAADK